MRRLIRFWRNRNGIQGNLAIVRSLFRNKKKQIGSQPLALKIFTGILLVGVVVGGSFALWNNRTEAATHTLSVNDLQMGHYDAGNLAVRDGKISLQPGSFGIWGGADGVIRPPISTSSRGGTNMVVGPGGNIYGLLSNSVVTEFFVYHKEEKYWENLAGPPESSKAPKAQLIYDNQGFIYYISGGGSNRLYRYDLLKNDWDSMEPMPISLSGSSPSSAVYTPLDGGSILIHSGGSNNLLYRYEVESNTWKQESTLPTSPDSSFGVSIAVVGTNTLYVQYNQRYDIANGSGDLLYRYSLVNKTWSAPLAKMPDPTLARLAYLYDEGGGSLLGAYQTTKGSISMYRYTISTNSWSSLGIAPDPPPWIPPAAYDVHSHEMYMMFGDDMMLNIHTFNANTDSWEQEYSMYDPVAPYEDRWNAGVGYDGNRYMYYLTFRDYSTGTVRSLFRTDLVTGKATKEADIPDFTPSNMPVYLDGALYIQSSTTKNFWKYTIATKVWVQLANAPFAALRINSLVNGKDGFLYAKFGNYDPIFKYNVAANTWEKVADIPPSFTALADGSALSKLGGYLYLLNGQHTSNFARYNLTTNSWDILPDVPNGTTGGGSSLASDGVRYIYVAAPEQTMMDNNDIIYRFDTQDSSWKRLADFKYRFGAITIQSSMFWDSTRNRLFVDPTLSAGLLYYWTPGLTAYQTSGKWYSKTYDLTGVEKWTDFSSTVSGSGASFLTRTSADGIFWSNWQEIANGTIASPPNRYMQVQVDITGSGMTNATVSNISFTYDGDTTSPSEPTQLEATSGATDNATLTSGETYEYLHPHFSWSGASDGSGSGVDGYWVYYGTNSGADPKTEGAYQTSSSYGVNTPMQRDTIYYLKVAVQDKAGNISNSTTSFSYHYNYISPPQTSLISTKNEFQSADNYKLDSSDPTGVLSLQKQEQGAWGLGAAILAPMAPQALPDASGMVWVNDDLYVLNTSLDKQDFRRYNRTTQTWETLPRIPINYGYGGDIINGYNGSIYVATGTDRNASGSDGQALFRFDIQANTWIRLNNLPLAAGDGFNMAIGGDGKIYMTFPGALYFYAYDVQSNTYITSTQLPLAGGNGSGLWSDREGKIYFMVPGASGNQLYVYSTADTLWRALATAPARTAGMRNNLLGDGSGNLYSLGTAYTGQDAQILKYSIVGDYWKTIKDVPFIFSSGASTSDNGRYIYWNGSSAGSGIIYAYDTQENRMEPEGYWPNSEKGTDRTSYYYPEVNVTSARYYSVSATDGINWYLLNGARNGIIRYNPVTQQSDLLPPPPRMVNMGSLAYSRGYLYYVPTGNADFYRLDLATRQWELMADLPAVINQYNGGQLVVTNDGRIYYAQGWTAFGFWRYTPDNDKGEWDNMAPTPMNYCGATGTTFTYDGTDTIYAACRTQKVLIKYVISTNEWSTVTNLPFTLSTASATLLYRNNKIYLSAGSYSVPSSGTHTAGLYSYDLSSSKWSSELTAPTIMGANSAFIPLDQYRSIMVPGNGINQAYPFVFPSANTAYNSEGTHISRPIQAPGLFDYAGIRVAAQIPENTDVEVYTRTSPDSSSWNEWAEVKDFSYGNGQITAQVASPPQLFTQLKIVLKSHNNVFSPTITSYALNYYTDTDAPSNATELHVYTDPTKTQELHENIWYNTATPFIDWPDAEEPGGASDGDGGSHVKGYYVYVGTDQTANPLTAGTFVTQSDYQPTLPATGNYVIRMQSEDMAGNVDPTVFAAFTYKLDITPPPAPALISVSPGGFTAKNDFSFEWPISVDTDSGVESYCYKTNSSSGPFSAERCMADHSLSHVDAAYTQGTNIFSIRTKDKAGNFSTEATSVSFYYSIAAPSAVMSLKAIPDTNTQNLFSFTWGLPSLFSGDPEGLTYCWSVNVLPSAQNTSCTPGRYLAPFAAATQKGANILYVVAKDETKSIQWSNFASVKFNAMTTAPGAPVSLAETDASDREQNRWAISLTWKKPVSGPDFKEYSIERSTDNRAFIVIGATPAGSTAFVDLSVSPSTPYYYRIRAVDNVGNQGASSATVLATAKGLFAKPPSIVSSPAVVVGFNQAIVTWVTERPATSFVSFGKNSQNLTDTQGSMDLTTEHSVTITGLSPLSIYSFKVQSFDLERAYDLESSFSSFSTFKTGAAASVTNVRSSDLTTSSAIVWFDTSEGMGATILYGPKGQGFTNSYKIPDALSTSHSAKLDNLINGTEYSFRINASSSGGTATSDEYTFKTVALPRISTIRFQPADEAGDSGVLISWDTNVPTDSVVGYMAVGLSKEMVTTDLVTSHALRISGISANTEYSFTIKGRDTLGNQTTSEPQKWHSGVDTRPAIITDTQIKLILVGTEGSKGSAAIISWKTDEPSSGLVRWSQGMEGELTKETAQETELTNTHTIVIPGLDLGSIYRFQIVNRDTAGNYSYGKVLTGVTPRKETTALDLLLGFASKLLLRK